jgi:phosphoribosylaminoimidazole-succinocarboxamide synthase
MLQLDQMSQAITETNFAFPNQTAVYYGKVRDVYTIADKYMVAIVTDRVSAFDVILPRPVPFKGQVLNQLAGHFLQATADIAPNWLLSTPDPNVSIGYKCQPFKIEMVIRGCLVGHSWRQYKEGVRQLCGEILPEGMQEYDSFPQPIITPATKAQEGHDEDISAQAIVKAGLATQAEYDELANLTRQLFARGQEMAHKRGLFLADTKYEFGKKDGKIYVIDEIHTPDSSRYFYQHSYQAYLKDRQQVPKHLSKEFLREWLIAHDFQGLEGQTLPELDDAFIESISQHYIELYEQITGKKFVKAASNNIPKRIEDNVIKALKDLK